MRNSPTLPTVMVVQNRIFIAFFVLLSLLLDQIWILTIPLVANLSCLFFKIHPLFMITKHFLRKDKSEYPQSDFADLHFNQGILVAFLSVSIISYLFGYELLSIISSSFVLLAILIASMGFCIGCFIRFQINQWRYKRN